LNVRLETITLPEEHIGGKLRDTGFSSVFEPESKGKGNKSKNKQMGLFQTKKLLHSEGTHHQNKKATY